MSTEIITSQAKTVLIYRAVPGEVQLDALETAPQARGKRIVFPRCVSDTEMTALLPHGQNAWANGYRGIQEPLPERSEQIAPEDIDLVICPCTVFDADCHRMGMGAGFYDRYLKKCTHARAIAVAFECQKTQKVPTAPWDCSIECVFTESEVYHAKNFAQVSDRLLQNQSIGMIYPTVTSSAKEMLIGAMWIMTYKMFLKLQKTEKNSFCFN